MADAATQVAKPAASAQAAGSHDLGPDPSLLIVDDDAPFLRRLARAMESRGFVVELAGSVAEGIAKTKDAAPAYAVVDLRLGDGTGLDVIEAILQRRRGLARHCPCLGLSWRSGVGRGCSSVRAAFLAGRLGHRVGVVLCI